MVEKGGGGEGGGGVWWKKGAEGRGGGDSRRENRYIEKERDMDKKRERGGEKIDACKRREIWIRRERERSSDRNRCAF